MAKQKIVKKKRPIKTMTARAAYDKAMKHHRITVNDNWFAAIGWKSPNTGQVSGPFFVTAYGDAVVEVDRHGVFKDMYPAKADCYFPWFE